MSFLVGTPIWRICVVLINSPTLKFQFPFDLYLNFPFLSYIFALTAKAFNINKNTINLHGEDMNHIWISRDSPYFTMNHGVFLFHLQGFTVNPMATAGSAAPQLRTRCPNGSRASKRTASTRLDADAARFRGVLLDAMSIQESVTIGMPYYGNIWKYMEIHRCKSSSSLESVCNLCISIIVHGFSVCSALALIILVLLELQ